MRREPPPTRYKVVERGRRLEVIDTWNGNLPVRREPPARPERRTAHAAPIERVEPARLDARGRRILNTRPWYDARGPRTILLTEAGEAKMRGLYVVAVVALFIAALFAWLFWPLLFLLPFALARDGVRNALRRGATAFLDQVNDQG